MKRRSFLKVAGGIAGSCALGPGSLPVFAAGDKQAELPRRILGHRREGFNHRIPRPGDGPAGTAGVHHRCSSDL